jgi:hypothetical protein
MHLIKPGLRHQDLEGIHLPSFRFSWKFLFLNHGRLPMPGAWFADAWSMI